MSIIPESERNFLNGEFTYICGRFNKFIPSHITEGTAEYIRLKFPKFDDEVYYAMEIVNHKNRYKNFDEREIFSTLKNEYTEKAHSYIKEFVDPKELESLENFD